MSDSLVQRAACIVLLKDSQVLLAQRSEDAKWLPGGWHVPGGKVDHGESPHQAASREIKEELGLDVSIDDLDFRAIVSYQQTDGPALDIYYFSATKWQNDPSIQEPDKCQNINWYESADPPMLTAEHTRFVLNNLDKTCYISTLDEELMYSSVSERIAV